MSTTPWGTMNGRYRLETEQRGVWLQLRVQDLRAAQVARQPESARLPESEGRRLSLAAADRQQQVPGCPGVEAEAEAA